MKRILILFFTVIIFFTFVSCSGDTGNPPEKEAEINAVWISVYDIAELRSIGEGGFRAKSAKMFDEIKENGFNHVFLHVRPSGDALYKSSIFPWSKYISGEEGLSPGYDPLDIFLQLAHERNLFLHAWINPYRISNTSSDMQKLSAENPAVKMYEQNPTDIFFSISGIYYNPASARVQEMLLNMVSELVTGYDIDGIHIDDFFYPTDNAEIDKNEYAEYVSNGGEKSLSDFRLEQINKFVSGMYKIVKEKSEKIIVSISPAGDIDANYNVHFADVKRWMTEDGFCDWIIPQIYFGFKNEYMPFKKVLDSWCEENKKAKLIPGLAAYKSGEIDTYAGSGIDEWQTNADILKRQVEYLRKKGCAGFSLFSYSSIRVQNSQMEKEWEYLKTVF